MTFFEFFAQNRADVLDATVEHAVLVLEGLGLAVLIGLPVAVLTYRTGYPRAAVLGVAGLLLTIPSYALFGLLITPLGLGNGPSIVALTLYALLPVLRNAIVGLREVDPAVTESARAMGMGRLRILTTVELPLAWPVVLAGLRVATQLLLSIAAIAAAVNGPGLGNLILDGLATAGTPFAVYLTLEGAAGIVVLAVLFELLFAAVNRLTTPRGLGA
ncbi:MULTISPECIES: ABC transporter permease [Streptomyces]|uniref:Binding-protein-dependent transport systems inner membrane component n=1 Tax=Streptomyces albus (strain ATCC 21838 / DSM 41398 / FERM P-419 / JCM 4703 / NBRC 107858) TaxID=1081613 RepID=A0A0B5EIX1_STRA4|nr:ABC transporter permease [Streptomyces sp. SCSIO ZS0520]AJE81429.1 binding-protein-dependent transport systems inner membrane component [Streptomyces albus]AOU75745.1 binding-protein-dependent transport systems inner membrane component [Streptomyces albus]AYN31548.1 ABC transporter permease [Streptomyces albus]UFZ14085.1 ABC transporter [Streptomyces sp.]